MVKVKEKEGALGSVVSSTLKTVRIGKPRTVKNMTVIPFAGNKKARITYTIIDKAIDVGDAVVKEVDEGGNVPQLKLSNKSKKFILINDGTQLLGAKQNRIVNATILVSPGMGITIPVSCVEAGRWNYRGRFFRGGKHHSPHKMRIDYVTAQHFSPKSGMWYVADQGKVWNEVDKMSQKLGSRSPTRSMEEVFDQKEKSFDEYLKSFTLGKTQTGFAVFINGEFCGLDLFDTPETLSAIHRKLLSGYVADALMAEKSTKMFLGVDVSGKLKELLREVQETSMEQHPAAVGVGLDERYEGKYSIGKCCSFESDLLHFSAFAKV